MSQRPNILWSNSMKAYVAIAQADELWHITLTRKGTIGPPWSRMLKVMLKGVIGINGTLPFPVYLLNLSTKSQFISHLHNGGWTELNPYPLQQHKRRFYLLQLTISASGWRQKSMPTSKINMSPSSSRKTSYIDLKFHERLWRIMVHSLIVLSNKHSA